MIDVDNVEKEKFKSIFLECLNTDPYFKSEIDKAFGIRDYVLQAMAALYRLQKDNDELMKLVRLLDKTRRG